ncbi:DUF2314 domain-containing protein [Kordia jejudonensis]|uniref:DUF2314 domain-containing protein n=1 Tax=Kordia jejudonensis TaxID=1348245 RepID=UPI0006290E25|nr:DUF2314 domain-containing protein [Kordia jejudonensis]
MKYLFFCFLLLNSYGILAQHSLETEAVLSEFGLYTMDQQLDEATMKKELKTIFPEIKFVDEPPKGNIDGTMAYVEAISDVSIDYPVHTMEYLSYFADGFSKTKKEELIASKNAFICVFYYQRKNAFTHSKKLFDWVYKKIKNTKYVVYDGEVRAYFSSETWKKNRIDAWENGLPNALKLLMLHTYRDTEYCRSITLGMQRLGLPDLVIEDSPCLNATNASQLLMIIAQLLVEGKRIENESLVVHLDAIKNSEFQRVIPSIVFENAKKKATIAFKTSIPMQEGDPMNTIHKVDFDAKGYDNTQAYENEIYTNLFGAEDAITHVNHNKEIEAASERAKQRLPALKRLFNKGLDTESLLLKAPFTTDEGGNEWMWIEVIRWKDETIEGILQNDPYYIKNLKSGAKVTVQQADVFDYILYKADGTMEGNETGKLIQKYGN